MQVLLSTLSCSKKGRLSPTRIQLEATKRIYSSAAVRHFKMETLRSVIRFVKPGDWLAPIDLKDAYLHIPIRPSHRKYLHFAFQGDCYQFGVLPFGLNTAPMVWTKVFAPIMEILHLRGIYISPYLATGSRLSKSSDSNTKDLSFTWPLVPPQPDVILFTDASKAGWGGHIPDCSTQGLWTSSESELHINIL